MDCHNDNDHELHGSYQDNKKRILDGLKRIEGQMRGIQRMVEEERYCVDVLNQIAASRMALSRLAVIILQDHTMGCVSKAVRDQKNEEVIIEELMGVVKRFI
ncbi:MAG: metal-sensitive transcriptional regulator [Bacillota bacterium]|nr:metal-sensitive transcriptional regulator [Bacillota bacterium]